MNAIGIICEYNPFHLGHARMLEGLRRQYDAPLVCAMSGNFVQRGDAAVAHKHARGEMAVRCGADLVLELPTPWAMASAERFADGGVALLTSTGVVSHLAFGSECGDLTALQAAEAALSQPELMPRIRQLLAQLAAQNVKGGCVAGEDAILLPLVGETWRLDPAALQALPYVQEARRLTPAYHLAARSTHPENTVVPVGDVRVGADFCLIAGPCAVESQVQMAGVARRVKAAGAQLLRGGVFKPRTSPYSFQGLGQAGISMLTEAGREAGLPTITEITDPRQLEDLDQVDILQVGARNMQNFALLQTLGQVRKPVLLKRGMSATVTELLQAAEYILAGGNERVILCERGIRTFETDSRATLDIAAIPVLKKLTHLPVIVDPSHAAGRAELVAPLALAAVAAGADGLMVEVHDRPACALSDGAQALSCDQFDRLTGQVRELLPHAFR